MNILHISPNFSLSCGVSKYVFEVLKYYSESNTVNIFFITNGGDALNKLKRINIDAHIMKFHSGISNFFFLFQNITELKKFCINNKINIIHTHHRYAEFLSVKVAKKIGVKTVTTAHSFVRGYKYFSFRSDKIIAVSNCVKNSLIKNFDVNEKKIETAYNCVPLWKKPDKDKIMGLKNELNIDDKDRVLLFLGRINKIKGIDILIGAYRNIKPKYPNLKLILVGEISDKTYKQMNVESNEDIIHFNAKEDINPFLEICDIVLLPSREDPFPFVMLEAGVAGVPFVGSRTGGISEFSEDNINGFLFESGNSNDLAEKIKLVLDNPELASKAAENLKEKVTNYCNCDEYFKKLNKIYYENSHTN